MEFVLMHYFLKLFPLIIGLQWSLWLEKPKDRVVIITAKWCAPCVKIKPKIDTAITNLSKTGWTCGNAFDNQIQIIDYDKNKKYCQSLGKITLPFIAKIENGKVVRILKKPVSSWSLGELYFGEKNQKSFF